MRLFICGNADTAWNIISRYTPGKRGVTDLYIFANDDELRGTAHANGLGATTESINTAKWPFEPDVIASIYYRTIIGRPVIDRVKGKIFNAHTSLLPRHRGRSPVPWAIIEGDQYSGVTYHYIDAGIDTGPILLQAVCQIDKDAETQTSLFEKINRLTVEYFPAALALVQAGLPGIEQRGEASYHRAGVPYGRQIDPNWPIGKIGRFIRAMHYPPLPGAELGGRPVNSEAEYKKALYERWKERNAPSIDSVAIS